MRTILTGRRLLVTAVAVAAVGGGGAATAYAAQGDGDDAVPSGTRVTAAQAAQAALQAAPGTVEEIDLDDGEGWEVDVVASDGNRTVTVDPGTGKVVDNRADRPDDDADDRKEDAADAKALNAAQVTAAAAAKTAAGQASGTVTSVDFHTGGTDAWEVEIAGSDGAEHEVTVHAASGKVLANHTDHDDDADQEDDD